MDVYSVYRVPINTVASLCESGVPEDQETVNDAEYVLAVRIVGGLKVQGCPVG